MRLRFWHAPDASDIDVDEQVDRLADVFGATEASFEGELAGALDRPAMLDCNVGDCDENADLTDDQASLFAAVAPVEDTIEVFVAEHLSDGDEGCARHPAGAPGVVVVRNHSRWVLAHEVGHLFNLVHVINTTRLMHKRPRDIVGTPRLVSAEVETVNRFFSLALVGAAAPARAGNRDRQRRQSEGIPALDVRADSVDFRDRMYTPSLGPVWPATSVEDHLALRVPVLDQQRDGACTGYALATVIHCLQRRNRIPRSRARVSPDALFDLARSYDEWPGEALPGSSTRATLKGWYRHGAPQRAAVGRDITVQRLGAYFRVPHDDIAAMQSAIREAGALFASSRIHAGWRTVDRITGVISVAKPLLGYHAFAIVTYDESGFWIQNSWGQKWGRRGLGYLSYDQWLAYALDVWAVQLGVPARMSAPAPIVLDDRGRVRTRDSANPRALADVMGRTVHAPGQRQRIVVYFPCGSMDEQDIAADCTQFAATVRADGGVPLTLVWASGVGARLRSIMLEQLSRRSTKDRTDRSHERLDDSLEVFVRRDGASLWQRLKARGASVVRGSASVGQLLGTSIAAHNFGEVHVVCRGSGALAALPLLQWLTTRGTIPSGPLKGEAGLGLDVDSLALHEAACTIGQFQRMAGVAFDSEHLRAIHLFTTPAHSTDGDLKPYSRSLLNLVSASLEAVPRRPKTMFGSHEELGVPVLGITEHVAHDAWLSPLLEGSRIEWHTPMVRRRTADESAAELKAPG